MTGRPPRTAVAVLSALKLHPELEGRPKELAKFIGLSDPSMSTLTAEAVSVAVSRLQRRLGTFKVGELCWDQRHIGKIIVSADQELTCEVCGRVFGHVESARGLEEQSGVRNPLHKAYEVAPMVMPRREGMISLAAVRDSIFGDGPTGRLTYRASVALVNVCKSHPELGQERTAELQRLVEVERTTRGRYVETVSSGEVKDALVAALVKMTEMDKLNAPTYLSMLHSTTLISLEAKRTTKSTKSTKSTKALVEAI